MRAEGICNCIVLYDFDAEKTDLKGWYLYIMDWFKAHEKIPTRMGLTGKHVKPSSKTKTFKHYNKVIFDIGFKDIEAIEIYANIPDHEHDSSDIFLSANLRLAKNKAIMRICFDDKVVSFDQNHLESFIKDVNPYLKARYGICYQRDFNKGPGWYAYGIISGLPISEEYKQEREAISKWSHVYGDSTCYKTGDLRDIYPLNILTQPHLDRDVYGQSLKDWIESSPGRGELKKMTDTLWSWWVSKDRIAPIQEELRDTGIILCLQAKE